MIEYLCHQKVLWDEWLRTKRHIIPEFEANQLIAGLHSAGKNWAVSGGELKSLFSAVDAFPASSNQILQNELNKDLILGGILSELTRNQK